MATTLIVPGLHGSEAAHWQTWIESRIEDSQRVEQADWHNAQLSRWAGQVRHALAQAKTPVWIIAHSFGCLATVHAAWDFPEKVAGAMLVAPADPEKFQVSEVLPEDPLGFASVVVASSTDPWMRLTRAAYWAERWGSRFINLGGVGHINVESGFGPWPEGLEIFRELQAAHGGLPFGPLDTSGSVRNPRGTLTRPRKKQAKRLIGNWHDWLYGI